MWSRPGWRDGCGSYLALFGLCIGFASAATIFLNLDTTAALLIPVMLATVVRGNISRVPLAMLAMWLANTASLLLTVSNLTNLLAFDGDGHDPIDSRSGLRRPSPPQSS